MLTIEYRNLCRCDVRAGKIYELWLGLGSGEALESLSRKKGFKMMKLKGMNTREFAVGIGSGYFLSILPLEGLLV
jgi:hypothetical protein